MRHSYLLRFIKKDCLVYDIETWAESSSGNEIDIKSKFDLYVSLAQVKWFGAYSYKSDTYYILDPQKDRQKIEYLLKNHNYLIGFNSEEFDYPILKNNGFINEDKKPIHLDCMQILGKNTFRNRNGYPYKGRGELMDYKFKNNSLKEMARAMGLESQKGEIDYHIFKKNEWDFEEEMQIQTYLNDDILIAKQMFEKLWDFWLPFTELLEEEFVKDMSWIKSSIASLTYKAACSYLKIEPTYAEHARISEEMGGNVLLPKYEEARNVWYLDFASLYPHIMCMFNLLAETTLTTGKGIWHGNEIFNVRGHYDINTFHPLNRQIESKLKERIELKKKDKNNPMVYALKIFLNGLYGVIRSSIFEKVHTPNAGWDTCWLGQQVQAFTIKKLEEFGFEAIYGDTDSCFVIAKDKKSNTREYVLDCLKKILEEINKNVPFPVDTFNINIENYLDYISFPFSEEIVKDIDDKSVKIDKKIVRERRGHKKNYLYIYTDKDGKKEIKLVGLPIIKENATSLGIKIYEDILKNKILEQGHAKFSEDFIKQTINEFLKQEQIMELIAQEYKVNPAITYKKDSQIQAQISQAYLNGESGIISLIKNKKIGKVGKGTLYCTIEEAKLNALTAEDLDLEKLWNELTPFIDINSVKPIEKKSKKKASIK
jgi:DNA polymerase elongation subunit (family B)